MTGYRRAAMTLHGVAAEDRSWVLNALPANDRDTLVQLLDELKELGFADDAGMAMELASEASNAASYVPVTVLQRIRQAKAGHLFSILEHEPSSLIAQFLSIERWSWSRDFLNLFPAARKERILASVTHSIVIASARAAFLMESVGTRLSDMTPSANDLEVNVSSRKMDAGRSPLHRLVKLWTR